MKTELTFGTKLSGQLPRDAIHVATAAVRAATTLGPGQHIGFVSIGDYINVATTNKTIGIVDPFLTESVKEGEWFWMFLYPRTVTSLHHAWEHPAFKPVEAEVAPALKPTGVEMTHAKMAAAKLAAVQASAAQLAAAKLAAEHKQGSSKWMDDYAASLGVGAATLIEFGHEFLDTGNYLCDGSRYEGHCTTSEFWHHFQIITGRVVPEDQQGNFFNCSC